MNRTATFIEQEFLNLLEERPYNKITVKNIVEACNINRNTFYYHFHDIPELLETILKETADKIIKEHGTFGKPIDCLKPVVEYCTEYRRAVLHIYRSEKRDNFLINLNNIAGYVVETYLNEVTGDIDIPEDDKRLLMGFYKALLVGVTLDWLDNDMRYDLLTRADRLSELFPDASRNAIMISAAGKDHSE